MIERKEHRKNPIDIMDIEEKEPRGIRISRK
jgi:hypothetical protein